MRHYQQQPRQSLRILGLGLGFLGFAHCALVFAQPALPDSGITTLPPLQIVPEAVPAGPAIPPIPQPVAPKVQELSLSQVLNSLDEFYPLLAAVSLERGIAAGDLLAAEGAFDLRMHAASISQPMGFYKNYRNAVGFEQPTWQGGKVTAGYRIGDDDFPVWYGERVTNEGGEFALGALQPFWKDRAIDKRRAEIFKAQLKTRLAEPKIRKTHINFAQQATYAYWNWVANARSELVYQDYLRVAQDRDNLIRLGIERGNLPRVEQIDNQRIIASRESSLVAARRKRQKAAIELSLFLRDPQTFQPLIPDPQWMPRQFPEPQQPDTMQLANDIGLALAMSPELARIRLEQRKTGVQIDYARNQQLPEFDGGLYASKDVGAQASKLGDKTPFELEAGLYLDVPLQRRAATGMVRTAEAELAQWRAEERYASDSIAAKTRDSILALQAMYERITLSKNALELARQMEQVERRRFAAGQSNMLFVNLREGNSNDAELQLIAAYADYYFALADYRAALSQNTPLLEIR